MQDQMFATQAIKQIDEHEESDYRTITVLLLTSNLHIFLQLMPKKGDASQLKPNYWHNTLLIRNTVTVIASTSFTQGP